MEGAAEAAFCDVRGRVIAIGLAIAIQRDGHQAATRTNRCAIRTVWIARLRSNRQRWEDRLRQQSPQHERQHAPRGDGVGAESAE